MLRWLTLPHHKYHNHNEDEDPVLRCTPRPHTPCVAARTLCSRILTRFSFDSLPRLLAPAHSARLSLPQKPFSKCSASHPSFCYFRQDLLRRVLHTWPPMRFCTHGAPPYL